MKVLLDYTCESCGKVTEFYNDPSVQLHTCPNCGSTAHKKLPAPRFALKMGVDRSFPTMAAKWDKTHDQQYKLEKKRDS